VKATQGAQYYLEYLVIGAGFRNSSGEISGHVNDSDDWEFVELGFPVLGVGVTHLDCSFENGSKQFANVSEYSRREPKESGATLTEFSPLRHQKRRNTYEDQTEIDHEVFPQSQLATSNPEPRLSEWDQPPSATSLSLIGGSDKLEHIFDSHHYPYPYPYPYPPKP